MKEYENVFTVNEVAKILKVTPLTVRNMIKDKRLKSIRLGTTIRILESEVVRLQKGE